MTCPCHICEERVVGCQTECEARKVYDAWRKKQREAEYRQRNREKLLDDFKAESIAKQRRRRK